jgi:tRNA (guanine-N7-)-methyltransferase
MHQKQPPAKIAVLVAAGAGSAAPLEFTPESVATRAIDANKNLLIGGESFCSTQLSMPTAFPLSLNHPEPSAEVFPANYFAPLEVGAIFPGKAPLEVDLGCGDGAFLVEMAARHPKRNFLGIERMPGRVGTACRRITRARLWNARILRLENSYAVGRLLPPGSVRVFHLLFPDPWPKRRHARRRLVTQDFLSDIYQALEPNGEFRIVTDQRDYFIEIERLATQAAQFQLAPTPGPSASSTFEKRFIGAGEKIYRLVLRKVSPVA